MVQETNLNTQIDGEFVDADVHSTDGTTTVQELECWIGTEWRCYISICMRVVIYS